MLPVREEDIDRITAAVFALCKGQVPAEIKLPPDYPHNEVSQLADQVNGLICQHRIASEFALSLARGNLSVQPPTRGATRVTDALKCSGLRTSAALLDNIRQLCSQ